MNDSDSSDSERDELPWHQHPRYNTYWAHHRSVHLRLHTIESSLKSYSLPPGQSIFLAMPCPRCKNSRDLGEKLSAALEKSVNPFLLKCSGTLSKTFTIGFLGFCFRIAGRCASGFHSTHKSRNNCNSRMSIDTRVSTHRPPGTIT